MFSPPHSLRFTLLLMCAMSILLSTSVLPAAGQAAADHPGAILIFPYVVFDSSKQIDTRLILSNADTSQVTAHCFLENAVRRCSNSGAVCVAAADCSNGATCASTYSISDFTISLSPGRPVSWLAGSGKTGTIPAVSTPFVGALRCVGTNSAGYPVPASLEGTATLRTGAALAAHPDLASYNAYGFTFLGSDNGDLSLVLGMEYSGCPSTSTLELTFPGAIDPVTGTDVVDSTVALVPCSADFATPLPTELIVHFIVYNELDQRTGTSARLSGQLATDLSSLHPLFAFTIQGTMAGQLRIFTATDSAIGIAFETHYPQSGTPFSMAHEFHLTGLTPTVSTIFLPGVFP